MKFILVLLGSKTLQSHPVRGAWIEIYPYTLTVTAAKSHPVRGAWIEIAAVPCGEGRSVRSHPVRGAWIEISEEFISAWRIGRTPSGVRGLKFKVVSR